MKIETIFEVSSLDIDQSFRNGRISYGLSSRFSSYQEARAHAEREIVRIASGLEDIEITAMEHGRYTLTSLFGSTFEAYKLADFTSTRINQKSIFTYELGTDLANRIEYLIRTIDVFHTGVPQLGIEYIGPQPEHIHDISSDMIEAVLLGGGGAADVYTSRYPADFHGEPAPILPPVIAGLPLDEAATIALRAIKPEHIAPDQQLAVQPIKVESTFVCRSINIDASLESGVATDTSWTCNTYQEALDHANNVAIPQSIAALAGCIIAEAGGNMIQITRLHDGRSFQTGKSSEVTFSLVTQKISLKHAGGVDLAGHILKLELPLDRFHNDGHHDQLHEPMRHALEVLLTTGGVLLGMNPCYQSEDYHVIVPHDDAAHPAIIDLGGNQPNYNPNQD